MEFTITKQQVFDLASGRSKINELFPDVFNVVEFEENEWYINEHGSIINYQGEDSSYGINKFGEWFNNDKGDFRFQTWSNADPIVVTEMLIQQCVKYFGVDWENAKIEKVDKRLYGHDISINAGFYLTRFENNNTRIWNRNGCLLDNGIWAEPLKVRVSNQEALEIIAEKYKTTPKNIEIK